MSNTGISGEKPNIWKKRISPPRDLGKTSPLPSSSSLKLYETYARVTDSSQDVKSVEVVIEGVVYDKEGPTLNNKNKMLMIAAKRIAGLRSPRSIGFQDSYDQQTNKAFNRSISFTNMTTLRENDRSLDTDPSKYIQSGDLEISPKLPSDSPIDIHHQNVESRVNSFLTASIPNAYVTVHIEGTQIRATYLSNAQGRFSGRLSCSLPKGTVALRMVATLDTLESTYDALEVAIISKVGFSVISDVDDTIKQTGVITGARTVFKNTFARNFEDVMNPYIVPFYRSLSQKGYQFHYVSNSPWQLYGTLRNFLRAVDLPVGSVHLKSYTNFRGIFEPPAQRKRPSAEQLLCDFPNRSFILVGDSGEQDLELYVELAIKFAPRIKQIYICDALSTDNCPSKVEEVKSISDMSLLASTGHSAPVYLSSASFKKRQKLWYRRLADAKSKLRAVNLERCLITVWKDWKDIGI